MFVNPIKLIRRQFRNIAFVLFYKRIFDSFSCYVVEDPAEKEEIYKLRYEVYCKEYKYIDEKLFPNGLETDEYDAHSEHLVIRDKEGDIAATVRVINQSNIGFPITKHFKLNFEIPGKQDTKIVEISRLIVARKYRKKHLIIFLLKGLWLIAIQSKVTHAYCVIDEKLYPLLKKLHVPVTIIGNKQLFQGITFPCLIVISQWIEEVRSSKTLQNFFTYRGIEFESGRGKYVIH